MKPVAFLAEPLQESITRFRLQGNQRLVGSCARRGNHYWSDVDVMNTDLESSPQTLARYLAEKVKSAPHSIIIRELKAGVDSRFRTVESALLSRIPKSIKSRLKRAKGLGVEALLHDLHVLRWSREDILKGCLNHFGRRFTLADAIAMPEIVKLDLAVVAGNQVYDVSQRYFYNEPLPTAADVREGLEADIDLYRSTNPMKALKRMYSLLALEKGHTRLLKKLDAYFNSDWGLISKCISDLELLESMKGVVDTKPALGLVLQNLGNTSVVKTYDTNVPRLIRHLQGLLNTNARNFMKKL